MKKYFETRFMPNVKFLIPKDMLNDLLLEVLYSSIRCECRSPFPVGAVTSSNGDTISTICNSNDSYKYFNYIKEVSIYEAIPELIPEGTRYNKELDKLVPDVMQWQKVDNGANHIAADGTPFDTIGEALNHNCTLIAISSIDECCSRIKVEVEKDINITLEDRQILDELKKSGKSYLEIINVIKNTDTFKKHNGGDGNDYYDLPPNALQLQDLIEFKNMNANIKDIFKACWRKGDKKGVDEIYDVEKMVYYSLREAGKVLNTKDYISIATRIMGKQNVK